MKRYAFNLFLWLVLVGLWHLLDGKCFPTETSTQLETRCNDALPLVNAREANSRVAASNSNFQQEDWLNQHPELQSKLAKVREQFLLRRDRELQERSDIPHLSEIKFNGKTFEVVHFLGAGHGDGDGSAYVVRDGARERFFKVMKSKRKFQQHKIDMAYFKRKGIPIVEVLEEDAENLCVELAGTLGLSLDILDDSAVENYGLTSTDVKLIEDRRRAEFELRYDTKQYNVYVGNILMDIKTGKFFLLDPH